jgi:hypothetical protein
MLEHDLLEGTEQFTIRRVKPVRPEQKGEHKRIGIQRERKKETECPTKWGEMRRDILVLDYTNPGGLLTVTGTQPDPIRSGEADLDGEMEPNSQPGCMFPVKQVS